MPDIKIEKKPFKDFAEHNAMMSMAHRRILPDEYYSAVRNMDVDDAFIIPRDVVRGLTADRVSKAMRNAGETRGYAMRTRQSQAGLHIFRVA